MDTLHELLESCRREADAEVALLVGADGLVIEQAGPAEGGARRAPALDASLAGAEATDLLRVADRILRDALALGASHEAWCGNDESAVHLVRLGEGVFVLSLLAGEADPARARGAVAQVAGRLRAVLA